MIWAKKVNKASILSFFWILGDLLKCSIAAKKRPIPKINDSSIKTEFEINLKGDITTGAP